MQPTSLSTPPSSVSSPPPVRVSRLREESNFFQRTAIAQRERCPPLNLKWLSCLMGAVQVIYSAVRLSQKGAERPTSFIVFLTISGEWIFACPFLYKSPLIRSKKSASLLFAFTIGMITLLVATGYLAEILGLQISPIDIIMLMLSVITLTLWEIVFFVIMQSSFDSDQENEQSSR